MEKIKEFMSSPKKTAILGLVSSILMIANIILNNKNSLLILTIGISTNLFVLGFAFYFIIVLLRLVFGKGSIRLADSILIIFLCISIIVSVSLSIYFGININTIIYLVINLTIFLYLYNLLIKKKTKIDNKVFSLVIIIFIIYQVVASFINKNLIASMYNNFSQNLIINIIYFIMKISYIGVIPYFYNYYEILKEERTNGK